MSYRRNVRVDYSVEVRIGGLSLVLLGVLGGRSVHETLFGGGEWGPPAQLEPWLEEESSPIGTLLGGAVKLGEEVEIDWE